MNPKLSRLQRFILAAGLKTLPKELQEGVLGQVLGAMPKHTFSRNQLLISYFGLSYRLARRRGRPQNEWETNRIDWEKAGGRKAHNRVNASFYHSIKRLEKRGLVTPFGRGEWQLTSSGLEEAKRCVLQ